MDVIKEMLLLFVNFVLPVSLHCHCRNTTITKRLVVQIHSARRKGSHAVSPSLIQEIKRDYTIQNFLLNFITSGKWYVKRFTILALISILSIQILMHSKQLINIQRKSMAYFVCTSDKKPIF